MPSCGTPTLGGFLSDKVCLEEEAVRLYACLRDEKATFIDEKAIR
jgi:hypothetical protein